jgi:transposase
VSIKYIVDLTEEERSLLLAQVNGGGEKRVRTLTRCRILLMADDDAHTDDQIVAALQISSSTVHRIRQRFVEEGLHDAIYDRPRPGTRKKMDGKEEALLVATTCSPPPKGQKRWTLKLLADRLVALTDHDSLSAETIRRRLLEKKLKPWQKKMWCLREMGAAFVAQMEHILDLYAQPADP